MDDETKELYKSIQADRELMEEIIWRRMKEWDENIQLSQVKLMVSALFIDAGLRADLNKLVLACEYDYNQEREACDDDQEVPPRIAKERLTARALRMKGMTSLVCKRYWIRGLPEEIRSAWGDGNVVEYRNCMADGWMEVVAYDEKNGGYVVKTESGDRVEVPHIRETEITVRRVG